MSNSKASQTTRENLLDLYKHFESSIRNELGFVFQYFNFYIGLLSAISAATLSSILSINSAQHTLNQWDLVLMSGPIAIVALSLLGYKSIQVYYHRFTEAWVTKLNIESMLNLQSNMKLDKSLGKPLFISENKGFITQVDNPKLKKVFDDAAEQSWSAEKLSRRLAEVGITLNHARWTFICFSILSIFFEAAIIRIVLF